MVHCCVERDVLLAAHRAQHRQCDPDGRRHRMRIASRLAAWIRPVRTQTATRRPGLPRPGVGHSSPRPGHSVERVVTDAGVRVHRARHEVLRRCRLPAGRCVDVRTRTHRPGRRDAGRPAHHRSGTHPHAGRTKVAEPVQRRGGRRLRGVATTRIRRRGVRD